VYARFGAARDAAENEKREKEEAARKARAAAAEKGRAASREWAEKQRVKKMVAQVEGRVGAWWGSFEWVGGWLDWGVWIVRSIGWMDGLGWLDRWIDWPVVWIDWLIVTTTKLDGAGVFVRVLALFFPPLLLFFFGLLGPFVLLAYS
jgi:hypothetical protein